jgi:UDP-2,3-diacylglucosamine pyrophosphatase LpxH
MFTHPEVLADFIQTISRRPTDGVLTELVINGDLVDFLAESDEQNSTVLSWTPVKEQAAAVRAMDTIALRVPNVFESLRDFTGAGNQLTVLLGNHDIELSFPEVRGTLERLLSKDGRNIRFIFDNEAYTPSPNVLIEHGNRYDRFNQIDHDALRRTRSLLSRKQPIPDELKLEACPGSKLVASVINRIKQTYSFVDLLKPETEAMMPLLLALEPSVADELGRVLAALHSAVSRGMKTRLLPKQRGDIASASVGRVRQGADLLARMTSTGGGGSEQSQSEKQLSLEGVLRARLGDDFQEFARALGIEVATSKPSGGDISSRRLWSGLTTSWGLARLLGEDRGAKLRDRLPALRLALQALRRDETFREDKEPLGPYKDAVEEFETYGFTLVLFGHTHLPRDTKLNRCRYMNTGTWADVIRFPNEVIDISAPPESLERLASRLSSGDYAEWLRFQPNYALLELDSTGRLLNAELRVFDGSVK